MRIKFPKFPPLFRNPFTVRRNRGKAVDNLNRLLIPGITLSEVFQILNENEIENSGHLKCKDDETYRSKILAAVRGVESGIVTTDVQYIISFDSKNVVANVEQLQLLTGP